MLDVSAAKVLWLSLKVAAFLATVRLWRRRIGMEQNAVPPLFYFTFAFGSAALVDFTAGNIAIFEQFVLWLGFAALLSRRWWTFALLVVVAAQAKLTPIFFLGLLLVIDERPRWAPFLGGSLLFALSVGANAVVLPGQTREFLASISALGERGWGDPSMLGVMEDLVDQLRGLRAAAARGDGAPALPRRGRAVFWGTVRWWRARRAASAHDPLLTVLVTLAMYALVMPRMKDYSYVALLPVGWYALATHRELTASLAVLAVLVPRPVPQLKLWLPMVPQVYTYAPLIAALVLWSMLTTIPASPAERLRRRRRRRSRRRAAARRQRSVTRRARPSAERDQPGAEPLLPGVHSPGVDECLDRRGTRDRADRREPGTEVRMPRLRARVDERREGIPERVFRIHDELLRDRTALQRVGERASGRGEREHAEHASGPCTSARRPG